MPDTTMQELPLVASQFILQAGPEGCTLVVGQAVVSAELSDAGELAPKLGISWHTQLFISPVSMKKLSETLSRAVEDYESKIGPIATSAKAE